LSEKPAPDLRSVLAGAAKFAGLGSGAIVAYFLLQMLTPEAIAEVLKSWGPGFGTGAVLGGLLIWRADKRFGEGIAAVNGMADAQRGLEGAMTSVAQSLTTVAESHGTELEAIKASVGSLHGKIDDVLERLPSHD
jgi:hypothetical protein